MTLLHLLEGEGAVAVSADLHQLHSAEAAHAQSGEDPQVRESHVPELVVQPETDKGSP